MPASDRYGMPFRVALPAETIHEALARHGVQYRKRVYDPATTIWAWMAQIASQDGSCRQSVTQLAAHHALQGRRVSSRTGAYTQARQRLDLRVIQQLARDLGRRLESDCRSHFLLGRPLLAVDGTILSCPDTPSITAHYPKLSLDYAADGLGFPHPRVGIMVSLTTGAVMDLGIVPYRGKHTNELAIFEGMWPQLRRGDIVVGDRMYSVSFYFYWLPYRGIDLVSRRQPHFHLDRLHTLQVFGQRDRLLEMRRPRQRTTRISPLMFRRTPKEFPIRYTSLRVQGREGPTRLEIVSTLKDPAITKPTLTEIYRRRWNIESDIRTLKIDLGANILRCKSAEMIEKELWMTALTCNAVRYLMVRAATRAGLAPRDLSFKNAIQVIHAFAPGLNTVPPSEQAPLMGRMYEAIASHVVGNRPDRVEPRAVKRRPQKVTLLMVPRDQARGR